MSRGPEGRMGTLVNVLPLNDPGLKKTLSALKRPRSNVEGPVKVLGAKGGVCQMIATSVWIRNEVARVAAPAGALARATSKAPTQQPNPQRRDHVEGWNECVVFEAGVFIRSSLSGSLYAAGANDSATRATKKRQKMRQRRLCPALPRGGRVTGLMAPLSMTLLGGFQTRLDSAQPLHLASRKTRVILAYLAMPPGQAHPRDKLI